MGAAGIVFALAAAVLAGCPGDNGVCTTRCPAVEGTYAVSFSDTTGSADCASLGISLAAGDLSISRQGSVLNGAFGGRSDFTGEVFDTGDFTLQADSRDGGDTDSVTIRASYLPPVGDGGAGLDGTFTATYQRAVTPTTKTCTFNQPFRATRK